MNLKLIARFLGQIVALEAAVLIPALSVSLGYGEFSAATAIAGSMAIMLAVAGVLWLLGRKSPKRFGPTEGMVCVSLAWIALSLLGALPLFLSREIPRYIDALFEIVSGLTTTGASVVPDVEAMSHGLLLWRSTSNWLGGMGVLVLLLAIAPGEGQGFTMHLLRAESPGPDVGKLVPKMRKTAALLYGIYIALTFTCFVFLMVGKMPLFDAVCTALSTAGTGGFGIKADSMGSYSPYLQNVVTVFMFLFGINFSCYYLLLMGNVRSVLRDQELRMYVGLFAVITVLITLNIRPLYATLGETVRHAAFQVSTIVTTTGFATTDFDLWPQFSKGLLMLLMITGGCAGSTAGGFKCARVLLVLKSLGRNTRKVTSPKKVEVVRSNGKTVSESIVDNTNAYLAAYLVIIVLSYLVLTLDGQTVGTTLSAVLACFNNIGPGFEAVGPTCNFLFFGDLSKCVLIFDMLAGRLEIFPMLILFSRLTWRK